MRFKVGDCVLTTGEFQKRLKDNSRFYDECIITWVYSHGYEIRKGDQYVHVNEIDVYVCSVTSLLLQKMDIDVDADTGNEIARISNPD